MDAVQDELTALRAQVAELQESNAALTQAAQRRPEGRRSASLRAAVAAVLIVVSVILTPVAVLGTWARVQLVDTDRFVQTFAPLAEQPAVQSYVSAQVVEAIEENLDIDALVGEVVDGIASLDLPPRAQAALLLLKQPAAEGISSLLHNGVSRVVASPQFAQLWETALRETHSRATAVIQGDPGRALQLTDATLTLELSTVIAQVKQELVAQGFTFASSIPEIDRSITILTADSLALVRTVYQVAVAAGYWLPWLVLAMLVAGVALARNRTRAVAWAGAGLAVSLLVLAAGLGIGRQFFIGAVSPSVMPAPTALVIFNQLTMLISSTLLAAVTLSLFIAMGGWLAGASRPARAVRGAASSGFVAARAAADRRGIGTGAFGRGVERWRSAIVVAAVLIGVVILFQTRPITVGGVIGTLVGVLVVLLVVELIRRPAEPSAKTDEDEPTLQLPTQQ